MDFRWVAALTLWTVLSGPVLVDVVVSGNSGRQPRKVLVACSDASRAPSGLNYQTPASWTNARPRR
jgi:hypothetical protein